MSSNFKSNDHRRNYLKSYKTSKQPTQGGCSIAGMSMASKKCAKCEDKKRPRGCKQKGLTKGRTNMHEVTQILLEKRKKAPSTPNTTGPDSKKEV